MGVVLKSFRAIRALFACVAILFHGMFLSNAAYAQPPKLVVPGNFAAELQPVAPNAPVQRVWVRGVNVYRNVKPYTIYEIAFAWSGKSYPFYNPASAEAGAARADLGAYLPYSGQIVEPSSYRPTQDKLTLNGAVAVSGPGLKYWQPRPTDDISITLIDGYHFRTFGDLEHYLKRQPAGRVVEIIVYNYKLESDGTWGGANYVMYVPLLQASPELVKTWRRVSEAANLEQIASETRAADVRAQLNARDTASSVDPLVAMFTLGLGFAAAAALSAPQESPFEGVGRGSRDCREAGGVC
jgi:hypothetical protein